MKAEEKTRALLLAELRQSPATVPDLAQAVGLTNNAVRFHLEGLLVDGLVVSVGQRKPPGAGKPAAVYGLSESADTSFSRAYAPLLAALAREVAASLPGAKKRFMHRVGKRLAGDGPAPTGPLSQRVKAASDLLNSLGGVTEVRKIDGGYAIQSKSCPVAEAVNAEACVCHAIESLVGHVAGATARERCDRSGRPKCCFEISEARILPTRRRIA
jgi:predicted ArsR family transcriptional regulator